MILDFRGFDSSRILIPRGGIPRPIGNFPESSSRLILVWRFLVWRLAAAALSPLLLPISWAVRHRARPSRRPLRRPRTRGAAWDTSGTCMHVYMYACMHVCMYVCLRFWWKSDDILKEHVKTQETHNKHITQHSRISDTNFTPFASNNPLDLGSKHDRAATLWYAFYYHFNNLRFILSQQQSIVCLKHVVVCLFQTQLNYELWVVETIVRPPYNKQVHIFCVYLNYK